jgi:hypothetical protein
MSNFNNLKKAVQNQFSTMLRNNSKLFLTDVEKDAMWELYLDSFPVGTNEIYKTKKENDCNSCKQFIRNYGNIVAIDENNKLISIWDNIVVDYPFNVVFNNLSVFVKSKAIKNIFISETSKAGTDFNHQTIGDNIIKWDHFYLSIPKDYVNTNEVERNKNIGLSRDAKNVFKRGMDEITVDAGNIILDLIEQNSLYRGEEFKNNIINFITSKTEYMKLTDNEKDNWCWKNSITNGFAKIRNSAIGTLLIDLSEGLDINNAVAKFEAIVAPTNYKRPKALITKKMIETAQAEIIKLGYESALGRRFANAEDITINNVLFVDRNIKSKMNISVFDEMKNSIPEKIKNLNKIEEITINDFIEKVLPTISNMEIMFENKHQSNLMSLIAPIDKTANCMLKWNNNFSWSYNGDITDSIKQNVKKAGGNVNGVLRFSIQWNDVKDDQNDLDAHCIEPNGNEIMFNNKINSRTTGNLDIDIIKPNAEVAVENITWLDINKMLSGKYEFSVHNFNNRGGTTGFRAEIEYDGQLYSYNYNRELKHKEKVVVMVLNFSKEKGIEILQSLNNNSTLLTEKIWNIDSNKFQKVSMIMLSPNFWDGQKGIGNKHYFFILENCKNTSNPRGFFNEFLKEELMVHKRVFEVLGSKMRVEPSDNQLSGLGFSTTQKNSFITKITGNFTRMLKVNI